MIRRPPRSPLFPYPPLFRSRHGRQPGGGAGLAHDAVERAHLDEAHTVGAAQRVVVLALEPALPQQAPEPHRREAALGPFRFGEDRKSTRLNSSHGYISYAVF